MSNQVLVITRKLNLVQNQTSHVSKVIEVPEGDTEFIYGWSKDQVDKHKKEICVNFPEFYKAEFTGSVHDVSN